MHKVTSHSVLLLIGMSALVLVAATRPALAKQGLARAHAETSKSAHVYSARDWKRRHRAHKASRQRIRPHGYAGVYNQGGYPRLPSNYETDLLTDCLMMQPFVTCPFGTWGAPDPIPTP